MLTIEELVPGTWVSVPNVDEYTRSSQVLPEELMWAWYLSFDDTTKNVLIISVRESSLWNDAAIVTGLANNQLCEFHVKKNSYFGENTILLKDKDCGKSKKNR